MQNKQEMQYQILLQWQHELKNQSQHYLESVSRFYLICRETENDFQEIRNHLHGEQRDLLKFQCELDQLLKNVEIQLSIENLDSHFKCTQAVRVPLTATSSPINRNQNKSPLFNRLSIISLKLDEKLTSNVTIERIRQSTAETELMKERRNSEQREERLYVLAEKLKNLTNELENVLINSNVKKSQQWNQNNGNGTEYKCNNQSISLCENSGSILNKLDDGNTDDMYNTSISLKNPCSVGVGHTNTEETESSCSCNDIQKQHEFFENSKAELIEYSDYRYRYRCRYRKHFRTAGVNSDNECDKDNLNFRKKNYFSFKKSNCDSLNELLRVVENQLCDFWVKNDNELDRVTQCSIGVQTETLCEENAQPKSLPVPAPGPAPVSVRTVTKSEQELKLKPVQVLAPAQTTAQDSSVISASSFASIWPYPKPDLNSESESGDLISLDLNANFTLFNDFEEKNTFDKNFQPPPSTPPPILLPPPPINGRPRSLLERYKEMSKRLRDFPNGSGSGPDSNPATVNGGFNSHHYYLGKLVDILEFSRQNHTEYVETMELNKYISILTTKTTAPPGPFIGYGNTPLEATEMSISIAHNNVLNSKTGMQFTSSKSAGQVGPCLRSFKTAYRSGFFANASSGSAAGNPNNDTVRKKEWGNKQNPDFDGRHLGCGDGDGGDEHACGSLPCFDNFM